MQESQKEQLQNPIYKRAFQKMMKLAVYTVYRPQVMWLDPSLKKSLKGRPVIFTANHTDHLDGIFAGAVFDEFQAYNLVKKSWYDKDRIGTFIKWYRSIPIDLENLDADWYQTGEALLRQNGAMMIFPEGGVAREGKMLDFKPGAAMLAAKTGAVIVPCAFYGGYNAVFGPGQKVLIGHAIEADCPEDMRYSRYAKELTKQIETEIKRLYGALEHQYGRLPVYYEEEYASDADMTPVDETKE